MPRPKNPENPTTRSFRVGQRAWDLAMERAKSENTYMSSVCADLVEGYGRGIYDLPTREVVRTFPEPEDANNPVPATDS